MNLQKDKHSEPIHPHAESPTIKPHKYRTDAPICRDRGRTLLYAILTLLLMLIIFLFSSQPGPASSRLSQKVANAVMKFGFTRDVRKCAHIFLYFCLGTTASLFFDQCMNCTKGLKTLKTAFISIVFCFLYSCSDEWHQTFVAGRSGQLRDIGIDAVGFTLGIMCVLLLKKLTERK